MDILRKPPTAKGPDDTFTGDVWIDPITRGLADSDVAVNAVRFTPGARTAWHSHEGGQTLYVAEGWGMERLTSGSRWVSPLTSDPSRAAHLSPVRGMGQGSGGTGPQADPEEAGPVVMGNDADRRLAHRRVNRSR